MILKRQEKNGIIKAMYSSSTICASTYDTNTKDLIVIFNNGGKYKYPMVENTDYTRFETADSNGSVFNVHIKKKYTNFEKLEKLDGDTIKNILNEVDEMVKNEKKALVEGVGKSMIEMMIPILGTFVSTNRIDNSMITFLGKKIEEYKEAVNSIENQKSTNDDLA